ncbi:MAG TPA: PA2779 family protein, partial [Burkholderiales bacterium]|nr:PA2779 family protein [Burkholderiales bacterium]
ARELQALGIDPAAAKARVAALSDDEVRSLADRINAAPAGADAAGILLLVVVVALIWWAWKR